MPDRCTISEIAAAAHVTEKHVRRMVARAKGAGPHVSPLWFGRRMRVHDCAGGPEVEFAALPDHIREALVARDQLALPFTPPPPEHDKLEHQPDLRGHRNACCKTEQ